MPNDEERWKAARSRMLPAVKSLLSRDLGIDGEKYERSALAILELIFRPEYRGATDQPVWSVMRQDDNGNHFEIAPGLSHEAAEALVHQFEAAAHKQVYWLQPKTND